jgi:hypothetical protein
VYEDSVSTFVKAREQLLLSILDGLDVDESIEEYVIAKAVMEQDGFTNDITWKENICNSFVRKMTYSGKGYIPKQQFLAMQAEQNQQHLSKTQPWRGRVKRRGTSHHHDLEVADIGLAPYGDSKSNPFSSFYDPSKRMLPSGRSVRDDLMVRQMLPTLTNHKTHGKISAAVEHAQDKMLRKKGSPHHKGMQKLDLEGNTVRNFHGLGPLGGLKDVSLKTMHDVYERDYQRWLSGDEEWKSINPETGEVDHDGSWRTGSIADARAEGLSDEIPEGHFHSQEELALRKLHADDRARSWNHKHVDTEVKEQPFDYALADKEGKMPPAETIDHGYNLGLGGFIHQLQWFSPRERTAIMNKMQDGLDKVGNQDIKLPDGTTVSAGRIKRSTQHILNAMSNWGGRQHGFTNENVIPHKENNEEQLSDNQKDEFFAALHDIVHDDDFEHRDTIHNNLREALGLEFVKANDENGLDKDGHFHKETGKAHKEFNHLPKLSKHSDRSIKGYQKKNKGASEEDAIASHYDKSINDIIGTGHGDRLSKKEILYALGYNEDMTEMSEDDNHHYPNFSGPLLDRDTLMSVLAKAKSQGDLGKDAKDIRNDMLLHGGLYFDESEIDPEMAEVMQDLRIPDSTGHYGLGAFFAPAFAAGGLGRNPHTLMEMIFRHFSNAEGESHLGMVDGERITPNEFNIGMIAPFLNHKRGVFNTPANILSKYGQSQVNGIKGTTPKNQILANLSHLSPGLVNVISRMTDEELVEKYNKNYRINKPQYSSGATNSRIPHGKGYKRSVKKEADIGATNLASTIGVGEELPTGENVQDSYEEKIDPDQVSKFQHLWSHSIATMMGRGTDGRPVGMLGLTPASLKLNLPSFGARTGDDEAVEEFLTHFGLEDRMGGTLMRQHMSRIQSHHKAIEQMAMVLRQLKPEGTFSPDNPNLDAEIDGLFRDANMVLMHLPRGAEIELPNGETWTNNLKVMEHGLDKIETPLQRTGLHRLPEHMREHGFRVDSKTTLDDLVKHLGMGEDGNHSAHYGNVLDSIKASLDPNNEDDHRVLMSLNSMTTNPPELYAGKDQRMFLGYDDIEHMHDHAGKLFASSRDQTLSDEEYEKKYKHSRDERLGYTKRIESQIRGLRGQVNSLPKEVQDNLGLTYFAAPEIGRGKERRSLLSNKPIKARRSGQAEGGDLKRRADYIQHASKDLFVHDPNFDLSSSPAMIESETIGFGARDLHPIGVQGSPVMDIYGYSGLMDHSNHRLRKPAESFDATFGELTSGPTAAPQPMHAVPMSIIQRHFGGEVASAVQNLDDQNISMTGANQFMSYPDGTVPATQPFSITTSEPSDYAAFLLNPDSLMLKGDDTPNFVPPIRPMHRIFNFKDMEQLRGFTGSWVVSKWYEGERVVVMKLNDKVSAYNEHNSRMSIPDWVKDGVNNLGKKDCTLDGILSDDELHIIDITYYDDTDVTDMTIQERLKILRGQFDGYDNVTVPGPHDTRMTDDDGLEDTVKSLLEEHDCLLIRDGKSTYMKGEKRHPKWVLLRPNKNVNLRILDKRGKKSITYRLGAGPLIDDEGIENATVDYEGEVYLDVGTVSSPKSFEEGDIVEVEVTGIKRKKINGREVYDLNPVKIVGEGEGESSVSMETLNILAKSVPNLHFPHDVDIEDNTLIVKTCIHNDVFYTLEKSDLGYWVHSPRTLLSEFGESDYSIRLSDSLKPFWSQVASMMLKGKVEKRPIPEKKVQDKAKTLAEKNQLLKPQMEKAIGVMVRVLDVLEKGHFPMSGGKGLGIELGGSVESPRGPTTLDGEQTLPDYDMRARPTEDDEKPYPHMKRQQKKDKGIKNEDSGPDKEATTV